MTQNETLKWNNITYQVLPLLSRQNMAKLVARSSCIECIECRECSDCVVEWCVDLFCTMYESGTMTVIQNAFANTSSSIASAKVGGNIVDTLMPPLSALELLVGYIAGAVARGMIVAVVITIGAVWLIGMPVTHPVWALTFVILGSIMMGALGMVAAVFANKFDQLSAITNFLVTPLAFLSGTFYSIEALPNLLQTLCHWNPFFYIIDGVRFGTIGISDSSPWLGFAVVLCSAAAILTLVWYWLKIGYRMKA